MANTTGKKVDLLLPPELYKAAKVRAMEDSQPLAEWIAELVRKQLQDEAKQTAVALDWGRIDDRIDQRTAALERQIEMLSRKIEHLLKEQAIQHPLEETSSVFNSLVH
ncbi:MAG TPA: hypothetical protein V6C65_10975 [Allocoleopsis sp.]